MKHHMKTTGLGTVIAVTAVVGLQARPALGQPTAPTIISTCGYVISTAGDYVLDVGGAADLRLLNCQGSNGIWIAASNVTLSLNNHRLLFNGAGAPGAGILVKSTDGSQLRNVKIKGAGALVAWNVGIKFDNADKSSADGVTAANNRTAGIETDNVTRFRLTDSMMARNGTYGLKLRNSVEGQIKGNTVSANGIRTAANGTVVTWATPAPGIGIGIHGGRANVIEKNTVSGNFGDGIAIGKFLAGDDDSFDNEISENLSSGNLSSTGGSFTNLYVATGSGGNSIHDNESLNLEDDNLACGTNVWFNNTFITTYSSKVDTVGTVGAPLSVNLANVDTGALSCAR